MERATRFIVKYGAIGLTLAGAGWLGVKYLLPCLWPFILAFVTAAVCEPVVRFLSERVRLRRGVASALCVLVILLSLLGFFLLVVVRLMDEAMALVEDLPRLAAGLPEAVEKVERAVRRAVESAPEGLRGYVDAALAAMGKRAAEIPAAVSGWALARVQTMAAGAPGTLLSLGTYAVGSFFISANFTSIRRFLARQAPEGLRERLGKVKSDLLDGAARWLRAELILVGVTFGILTGAFLLLEVNYAAVIALVTALIDALPVFGTGAVLLPWAAVLILGGDGGRGAGLLMTYLVATVTRQCLEPKIIGDQFGVSPAAALLAMYAGFKLAGIAGMVIFPFGLMMLNEMNTKGYIRLWK